MKICLFDKDPRKDTDPSYFTNMGSFAIAAHGINKGLKEIGFYAPPDEADFVGILDGLDMGFKYKNKRPFIINVWDMINVLPNELYHSYQYHKPILFGFSNQITNLWKRYGVECQTVMPGCDSEFYRQTKEKNSKFTFLFNSFSNVRSGLDLTLEAYIKAFSGRSDVQLIIKNTSDSNILQQHIEQLSQKNQVNIIYNNTRSSFEAMRDLYSESHALLMVMRMSSWGLAVHESMCCNCIPIVGNFCPSNEMQAPLMINPKREISIKDKLPSLISLGLTNCYGSFSFAEDPRYYDFDTDEYAKHLIYIKENWQSLSSASHKKIVEDNWTWKKSAEALANHLKKYE